MFALKMGVIGSLAGILSGLLGVGGGFIMIPLLNAAGLLMREAAGLSLLYVACAASSGVLRHVRQGTVDPVLGLILILGATPLSPVGSYLATALPNEMLQIIYAFIVTGISVAYLKWGRAAQAASEGASEPADAPRSHFSTYRRRQIGSEEIGFKVSYPVGLAIGACVGFVSGLLGVGGGWLLVPLLVLLMHIPLRVAIGTSLLGILFPAIAGAFSHWRLGNLDLTPALPLIIPGILGAQIGALLLIRVPRVWLDRLMTALLVTASVYMLARGFRIL